MPRPHKCRYVGAQPRATLFKPAGVPATELQAVELGLDEVEALRLADMEGLYHDAAAERMGISRPTFGRLIQNARHKVAVALLEGRMLVFQGGPIAIGQMRVFACAACGTKFEEPRGTGRPTACPACGSPQIARAMDDRGGRGRRRRGGGGWRRMMDGAAGPGGGPRGRGRHSGGSGPPAQ